MISRIPSAPVASAPLPWARRLAFVTFMGMLAVLMGAGCVQELRGKSRTASHRRDEPEEEEEEEEEDIVEPGTVRRRMQKVVKEPDPFNLNKIFKDERTAEIERNLGVE